MVFYFLKNIYPYFSTIFTDIKLKKLQQKYRSLMQSGNLLIALVKSLTLNNYQSFVSRTIVKLPYSALILYADYFCQLVTPLILTPKFQLLSWLKVHFQFSNFFFRKYQNIIQFVLFT